ncbi:MAG: 3-dehydroquinate synthase [Ignavibacteria bacterium]|jgi:3-dehydroquinate synthase
MKKIKVKTGNSSYPVLINNSYLNKLPVFLSMLDIYKNLFIVVDENVYKYHKEYIKKSFAGFGNKRYYYILSSGERVKSANELKKIYNSLLENKFGRDTILIAIGGGVTGDIAGYAAATYMRGIQLVHVPTTLLAMIDSSIGGKTGINFGRWKNIIGAFYSPKLVFIDTKFLESLPVREFNSAIGELIKYGLIYGDDFYTFLFKNVDKIKSLESRIIIRAISESVMIKAAIVSQDEFETRGVRKILNLGHTFAHAIESNLGFRIKHGEAVILGIICIIFLSHNQGLLTNKEMDRLLQFPCSLKLPGIVKKINNRFVIRAMSSDKKNVDEKLMFVLLSGAGKVIADVPIKNSLINLTLNKAKKACFV